MSLAYLQGGLGGGREIVDDEWDNEENDMRVIRRVKPVESKRLKRQKIDADPTLPAGVSQFQKWPRPHASLSLSLSYLKI